MKEKRKNNYTSTSKSFFARIYFLQDRLEHRYCDTDKEWCRRFPTLFDQIFTTGIIVLVFSTAFSCTFIISFSLFTITYIRYKRHIFCLIIFIFLSLDLSFSMPPLSRSNVLSLSYSCTLECAFAIAFCLKGCII